MVLWTTYASVRMNLIEFLIFIWISAGREHNQCLPLGGGNWYWCSYLYYHDGGFWGYCDESICPPTASTHRLKKSAVPNLQRFLNSEESMRKMGVKRKIIQHNKEEKTRVVNLIKYYSQNAQYQYNTSLWEKYCDTIL